MLRGPRDFDHFTTRGSEIFAADWWGAVSTRSSGTEREHPEAMEKLASSTELAFT